MNWGASTWDTQWQQGYGEPATIAAIVTGVAALLSAGTTTALALKSAADRRQQARITQLKNARLKVKRRAQEVQARRIKVDQMIAASQNEITKAKQKAASKTPWVLYAGIGGIALITLIAARRAKRA